jgi:hypothetical protein
VDDLMVRLRKRATTPEEREEALARRGVARQASRAA